MVQHKQIFFYFCSTIDDGEANETMHTLSLSSIPTIRASGNSGDNFTVKPRIEQSESLIFHDLFSYRASWKLMSLNFGPQKPNFCQQAEHEKILNI